MSNGINHVILPSGADGDLVKNNVIGVLDQSPCGAMGLNVTFVQARQERITIWEGIFQVQIAFSDGWDVDQEIPGAKPKVTAGRKRILLVFQMTSLVNRFDIASFFTYIYTRLKTNFPFSVWTGFYDGRAWRLCRNT